MDFIKKYWVWTALIFGILALVIIEFQSREKDADLAAAQVQKNAIEKQIVENNIAAQTLKQSAKDQNNKAAVEKQKLYDQEIAKMDLLDKKWADAMVVADASARISLPQPMAKLLELKREAESSIFSECLSKANRHRVNNMALHNQAMNIFWLAKDKETELRMIPLVQEASDEFKNYQSGRKSCNPSF